MQVYVTDDDIIQTSEIVDKAFAEMKQYGLKLAQPSLCSSFESQTWQGPLFKDPRVVLHYTTFVEIMVPMFEMEFFVTKVVRTLEHAETGTATTAFAGAMHQLPGSAAPAASGAGVKNVVH